jgi:hypothetical protein
MYSATMIRKVRSGDDEGTLTGTTYSAIMLGSAQAAAAGGDQQRIC